MMLSNKISDKNVRTTVSTRESNFELLRILCIFGIVSMHTFGQFYNECVGINLIYGLLINSFFNTGVTLFILISGYFGIRGTVKKAIGLEITVICYSVLATLIHGILIDTWSIQNIVKSFLPLYTNKYWFMTSYMLLLIFSNYINKAIDNLEKVDFQKILILMLIMFSIVPSIIQMDILGDSGKGPLNMLLAYMIGRYLKLYGKTYKSRILFSIGLVVLLLEFVLNYGLSMLKGGVGVYAPFARDSSIFIVGLSVIIFMLFSNLKFKSLFINNLAKHVVAVYLLEGSVREMFNKFINLSQYANQWYLFIIISLYVICVMICSIFVDIIKNLLLHKVEDNISIKATKAVQIMFNKSIIWLTKII